MSDNSIQCSGTNTYGQAPAKITSITQPQAIQVGTGFSCATDSSMNVWCWGEGTYLGNGNSQANTSVPVETISSHNVWSLSVYGTYSCAIEETTGHGYVYCWGNSGTEYGQQWTPTYFNLANSISIIAVAENGIACAIGNSDAWCWGGTHTITQQNTWSAYSNASTNGSGQMCMQGTNSGQSKSQCYTSFQSDGDLM